MDRPCSAHFVGNLVGGSRELVLIEAKVGGSCFYQGKYVRLVDADGTEFIV